MPNIHILPDHVINKIAAGEVIENTSSVVKEFVENALDAGASEITVEILGGGRQMIRVSDNGCGMARDDAYLCLERHATSKLKGIEDFDTLMTMGFRGEAVPSVASISKMTLITSNGKEGTLLVIDGGTVVKESGAVRDRGTTFEVKSLFFNVPVRKKFQRSPAYDTQEIVKLLKGMALAHLESGFQLISDGVLLLSIPSFSPDIPIEERLKKRISLIFGEEYLRKGRWISSENNGKKMMGVVGNPGEAKHQKTGQLLIVNGRIVKAPLMAQAIRDGYGSSLMEQRHPVYCLSIVLPGEIIDVNVHPQKREVRLTEESLLRSWIAEAVEKALWKREEIYASEKVVCAKAEERKSSLPEYSPEPFSRQSIPTWEQMAIKMPDIVEENFVKPLLKPIQNELVKVDIVPHVITTFSGYLLLDPSTLPDGWKGNKEGLYLLDQRRAWHRIVYEQLIAGAEGKSEVSQMLIIPYTYECEAEDVPYLIEILPDLHKMGLSIKEFGGRTFMIDALPLHLERGDLALFINEALEEWKGNRTLNLKEKERWLNRLSRRMAFGKKGTLLPQEAQTLVKSLVKCASPTLCPLGKPIVLCLDRDQLDKIGG